MRYVVGICACIVQIIGSVSVVQKTSDSNRDFSVEGWVERETFVSDGKPDAYREQAFLRIANNANGTAKVSRLADTIDIDSAILTSESRLVTITEKRNGWGHRIILWDLNESCEQEMLHELFVYWPSLSPNEKWVFYEYWYPRTGTPEEFQYTSTWVVDITKPTLEPVLVYPPNNPSGRDPDGRIHAALLGGPVPLWSQDSRRLYYLEYVSWDYSWSGSECFIIEVGFSDAMAIEHRTAYQIEVGDFTKPGVDANEVAFSPRALYWVDESKGLIGGELPGDPHWKSTRFNMTITGKYVEPEMASEAQRNLSGPD